MEITLSEVGIFVTGLFFGALFGRLFTFGFMALCLVILFALKFNG